MYYYEDGVKQLGVGLILIDGDYYYVKDNGEIMTGQTYWVAKTNDLMPEGPYSFGDDGKMIMPEIKNGIYSEEGTMFYYVNNSRTRSRVNINRWLLLLRKT